MKTLFLLISCCILLSCGSSQDLEVSIVKSKALDKLVAQKEFMIVADWASPLAIGNISKLANIGLLPPGSTAGSINLAGNVNYFRIEGDSISLYLPYYGEQRISRGFGTDAPIEFEGVPDKYTITYNEKKQRYSIDCTIKKHTETFTVQAILYSNWTSDITVQSNHRTSINYRGKVLRLEKGNNKAAVSTN